MFNKIELVENKYNQKVPLITFEISMTEYQLKYLLDILDDFEELKQFNSNMILNTISSLYSKFYLPERIRIFKNGIKIK